MLQQTNTQQILNIFIWIQQAFVFRITKSIVSISFNIEGEILTLKIYVFETINDNEQCILNEVEKELNKKIPNKITLDIKKINNKINLLDLDTFKYKFYLKKPVNI